MEETLRIKVEDKVTLWRIKVTVGRAPGRVEVTLDCEGKA